MIGGYQGGELGMLSSPPCLFLGSILAVTCGVLRHSISQDHTDETQGRAPSVCGTECETVCAAQTEVHQRDVRLCVRHLCKLTSLCGSWSDLRYTPAEEQKMYLGTDKPGESSQKTSHITGTRYSLSVPLGLHVELPSRGGKGGAPGCTPIPLWTELIVMH